jgi:hypothetical protein
MTLEAIRLIAEGPKTEKKVRESIEDMQQLNEANDMQSASRNE